MPAEIPELDSLLRHAAWVRHAALGLTRDAHRAEDLAQETWANALTRPPSSGENIRGWLGAILRNAARSFARGDSRRRGREKESARPECLPSADSLVEEAELAARLAREVDALEEPYRTAIVLVYFEGRTAASIAREAGLPEATVRSHVHRGLQRLRERLAEERRDARGAWIGVLAQHAVRRAATGAVQIPAAPGGALVAIMGTKTLLAVTAVASIVVLAYFARGRHVASTKTESRVAVPGSLATSSSTVPPVAATLGERVAMIPDASASEASRGDPESDGSVLVHVRWAETGEPAAGVFVGASYRDDPSFLEWQVAPSGADGNALLEGLHAGPLRLLSDRGAWADVDIRAGEQTEKELAIPRGIDVSGRVIDAAGRGVAGASITLSRGYSSRGLVVAKANDQGRFELRDVMVGQSLGARAPGREPTRIERIAGLAGTKVDIVLRFEGDGATVEGVVLDATGGPIAGALVCVGDEHSWQSAGGKPSAAGLRVRCGEDGRFRVEGVPVGTIPITARARGFAPARTTLSLRPGTTENLELHLGRGATLEGLVLGEEGATVEGARISVGTEPYARPNDLGFLLAESGPGGRYELACVPAGEVEVRVETEQDGKASDRGLLVDGERRRLDFHLSRGNVITGRLVDPQGHGLARWLVDGHCTAREFRNEEDVRAMGWSGYTRSGEDGSFLISNCPALEVTLSAFAPHDSAGQPAAMLKVEKPPAKDLQFIVPASIAPTAWIHGRLRMSDGGPIPSMELYAFDPDHKNPRVAMAEIDGKTGEFRVGPLGPGAWGVEVQSDRVCRLDATPVELVRDEDRDLGTVDLVAAGFVRAKVVHRERGNWKKVRIGLFDRDTDRRGGHNERLLQFDLTGTTWKSPPLAPGSQWVVIQAGDHAEERRELVIRPGEETALEIEVD